MVDIEEIRKIEFQLNIKHWKRDEIYKTTVGEVIDQIVTRRWETIYKKERPLLWPQRSIDGTLSGIVVIDLDKLENTPYLEEFHNSFLIYRSAGKGGYHVWTFWKDMVGKPVEAFNENIYSLIIEMVQMPEKYKDHIDWSLKNGNLGIYISSDNGARFRI